MIAFVRCVMGTWVFVCRGLPCGSDCFLMRATAGFYRSNVVDLYDSGTGRWSTAQLSQARWGLSATSVGTLAFFAGGEISKLLKIVFVCFLRQFFLRLCDVLWEHVCLCLGMPCGSDCFLMRATAGGSGLSNVVDLYDSGTGRWSTAQLSQASRFLSATSVGTVALFAGGDRGMLLRIVFVCCARDR